jgi:putative transposase
MVERSNHVVYEINYHFLCPKYRNSVLTGKVKDSVKKSFRETCEKYDYSISTSRVLPDHVHLFLSSHPKNSPSEIVRVLKSKSARKAWSNCESTLEEFYWGGGFWEESYYVSTAGGASSGVVEDYIDRSEHV